ncbi:phosphoribosylanthranilate isomerase [soil metagenome]
MKIKVCGITLAGQLQELDQSGVDYAGLIFYDKSPRHVLPKLRSKEILNLNLSLKKVGVFVNETVDNILDQVEIYGLDMVQLHGYETPSMCKMLKKEVCVMKVFHINDKSSPVDWLVQPYQDVCQYFLFDHATGNSYGGTGSRFNWALLKEADIGKEFFLSGGISPDSFENIRDFQHPYFFGIDINSRFETAPGIKDMEAVKDFVKEVNRISKI